ncbi:MAG: hypothetical protein ABFR75_08875 [Acidobacteriota bacterium]
MSSEYENTETKATSETTVKMRVLLYTAVFFVAFSIYTFDSFSTWKFLAVFIPLALSLIKYRGKWILLAIGILAWFGVMLVAVGSIYNHDMLELTGPLVCPEGYRAEVVTIVQNPVPGETYTSARMYCINDSGKRINPGWAPNFILMGIYFAVTLLLFIVTTLFFRITGALAKQPWITYLAGSALYIFLARLVWLNKDQIILFIKNSIF